MRPQTIGIAAFGWLLAAASAPAQPPGAPPAPDHGALAFFISLSEGGEPDPLRTIRPAPIALDLRRRVVAGLPPTGALTASPREAATLDSLGPILARHERLGVIEPLLIDVPQAFVGLHGRAVILISRPALRLVSAAELQALVAHELGHDYFWADYERARTNGDAAAHRELELKCDGIAVLTLMALEADTAALTSAIRKLTRFNEALGADANRNAYPSLGDRVRFVRELEALRRGRQTRR